MQVTGCKGNKLLRLDFLTSPVLMLDPGFLRFLTVPDCSWLFLTMLVIISMKQEDPHSRTMSHLIISLMKKKMTWRYKTEIHEQYGSTTSQSEIWLLEFLRNPHTSCDQSQKTNPATCAMPIAISSARVVFKTPFGQSPITSSGCHNNCHNYQN